MIMLAAIIERRRTALISQWVRDPLVLVQVEAPVALPGLVFVDPDGSSAASGKLGRRAFTSCALVRGGSDRDSSWSAWVAADYSSYRAAYLAFIRDAYGINATAADLVGWDVDHLLNRARSPLGSTFIRIEAIPAVANQEWGRLFEKAASNPQFFANQARQRRTMSWMICAKLAGQVPPRGPQDAAGITRLVSYFRGLGLPEAESQQGLSEMLSFACRSGSH
ncbi:hypothetical protein QA641_01865 [Bradyrhizobium sp. CB1650]|uniref:hypothetical protein n=1 Tax=Bradyrhizobium sp. CB1650 TaxID=3039153 RepID=UPI002435C232|nr:hypothetical protein [Bradyrhizobium sp. CB1650]WGD52724.1 hypothetical protein QA641_01865 [Bradyrhizobium sp. CB1650]